MAASGTELSTGTIAAVDRREAATIGPQNRLLSLDVFRGLTIASMMLVNNPGGSEIYAPLRHAAWHGWTFTDTVFPFFLWIAGMAMTISFARRVEAGADRGKLVLHTLRRSAMIFGLGLLLNGFPYYNLATIRIPGVLQRIAVCYFLAAVIFLFFSKRGQAVVTVGLLAVYWALMQFAPVPGIGAGGLERDANFSNWVDGLFLSGHMYGQTKTWDPEGIVSTLPAISTTMFGILTGHVLRSGLGALEKAGWIFFSGNLLIFAGLLMDKLLPINKQLWTSSFAVFMAGLAAVTFACCYWLIEIRGWKGWCKPLAIYGSNAIGLYALSGILARTMGLMKWKQPIYESFLAIASPINASLLYAICFVMLMYLVAAFLYRRGWFLRF